MAMASRGTGGEGSFANRVMAADDGGWTGEMAAIYASMRPVMDETGAVQHFERPARARPYGGADLDAAAGGLAALVREREEMDRANELAEATWQQVEAAVFGEWEGALLAAGVASPSAHRPRVNALRRVLRDAHGKTAAEMTVADALVAAHVAFHATVVTPLKASGALVSL